MLITFLGHAGFCVESQHAVIVMDPWLSPGGAFDASWFQLPRNHHLAPEVERKLAGGKRAFVYVSHEHQDHFDRAFLESLRFRDFTLVVPAFRRPDLWKTLRSFACSHVVPVADAQSIAFPGGMLRLYLDDSELNRDSAIFVRAEGESFLNLNDCRIFDRLGEIVERDGPPDVLASQYSGSSWHPICYEYETSQYEPIVRRKSLNKARAVEGALQRLRPRAFLASAGPPCFLDPELYHINFDHKAFFLRANELIDLLRPALDAFERPVAIPDLAPGDVVDARSGEVVARGSERVAEGELPAYLATYARDYAKFFTARRKAQDEADLGWVAARMKRELVDKLAQLTLAHRVGVPLYYGLTGKDPVLFRVDFQAGAVTEVAEVDTSGPYRSARTPAWQVAKVLAGEMTWENFALAFRVRLRREPDVYDPLVHAFLTLSAADLGRFCRMILRIESMDERIAIDAGAARYTVQRYCPHNGGDLTQATIEDGSFLVCPRHKWRFDLRNGGRCTTNETTIRAQRSDVLRDAAAVAGIPNC